MLERCVAEWGGERGCDGNEEDWRDDGARREDWSDVAARSAGSVCRSGGGDVEVGVACERGECGLEAATDVVRAGDESFPFDDGEIGDGGGALEKMLPAFRLGGQALAARAE